MLSTSRVYRIPRKELWVNYFCLVFPSRDKQYDMLIKIRCRIFNSDSEFVLKVNSSGMLS